MRWAEQSSTVQNILSLLHIAEIFPREPAQSTYMIICMVTYAVSSSSHFIQQFRVTDGILPYHKKGSLDVQAVQNIKDVWRCLRDGTIIESQIN